jgi:outer membrane immunogenic protein
MRRTLVGFIAALALGSVSPAAFAADMVPEPAPVSSWTGFYLGAGGGVGWADFDVDHKRCVLDGDVCSDSVDENWHDSGDENSNGDIIGTVQGGFDYELAPSIVFGVYADWTFGDGISIDRNHNHDDWTGFHDHFDAEVKDMVDVLGRVGFAPTPNLLVFALGGWTWADVDTNFRVRDDSEDWHNNNDDNLNANGFTVGGGLEWKFTDNLSVRGEYRFTDLEDFNNNHRFTWDGCECDFRDRNDVNVNVQRVLFTLNWRFGGFGATTAAAY